MPQRPKAVREATEEQILSAAREVFVADPAAPISQVAARAGVGMSALYARYSSKENLLALLCLKGQQTYLAEIERALSADDPWEGYLTFLRRIVTADTHALSSRLAGTFTPTSKHLTNAEALGRGLETLFVRARDSGRMRLDVTALDIGYLLEMLSALSLGDTSRTQELRQRYLSVIIDGLAADAPTLLTGEPPTWAEQEQRWRRA